MGTAVCGSELRKKGAAVEAVGWSNRVCWRKTVLLHGNGPSLLEEEETRGRRGVVAGSREKDRFRVRFFFCIFF